MSAIVVMTGAADADLLRTAAPAFTVTTITDVADCPQETAQTATVLVVRSGVVLDATTLGRWHRLAHVIRAGSGTDGFDLAEFDKRGITLHRNPAAAAEAVAEWVLAAVLSLARRIPYGHAALTRGQHAKHPCIVPPLSSMNVAIWGAGPIGQAAAHALAPHVHEHTFAHWPSAPEHLPQQDPDTLPAWADIHVIALPLTPRTRGMFDRTFFHAASPRAPLVICAGRLNTLNTGHAFHALDHGHIAGLAIDPVDPEHLDHLPQSTAPRNLLLTPHIGAQRTDIRHAIDTWTAALVAGIHQGAE